jgi:hypothetical protein
MTRMEATRRTDNPRQQAEPVYLESTLLRVFGVLFCHDPKRARSRTGKIEINRGVAEKGITVRFDPEYAQPGPFAHKVAMAVIRKQSNFGRPAQKAISFSQRELIRMTGRKNWGGRRGDRMRTATSEFDVPVANLLRLTENRARLICNERSCQAHCLGGCRSVSIAGSDRGRDFSVAAADHCSATNRPQETNLRCHRPIGVRWSLSPLPSRS